VNKDGI